MSFILQAWQLLILILAGWISRRQQEVIEPTEEIGAIAGEVECCEQALLASHRGRL